MTRFVDYRRIALYKRLWRSGGVNHCFYCQERVFRRDRSLDHLTPKSRGGTWSIENIVLCHRVCNWAKADMTLVEFNQFVMMNGGIHKVKEKYGNGSHSRKNLAENACIVIDTTLY